MIGNSFYNRVRSPVFNFFGTFHPSSKKMTVLVLDSGGSSEKSEWHNEGGNLNPLCRIHHQ